jgi:hypothetical protein
VKPPKRNDVGPRVAAAKSRSRGRSPSAQTRKRTRAVHDVCEAWCTEPNEPLPGWRKPVSNRSGPGEASIPTARSSSGGREVEWHRERLRKERRSGEIVRWKTFLIDARCSPFTGRVEAAVSIGRTTTLRVSKDARGRIERSVTERHTGRPHGRTTGRKRPRGRSEERMPDGRKPSRSSRPGSAWGAVKRAMHLHARSAKARRAWVVAERRSSQGRSQFG